MITHILYQLMGKFGVASEGFRKVLAVFISIMIFGLMYAVVKFTGMVIPNFTRNLVMLSAVDLAGFGFLMWKQKPVEKPVEEKPLEEKMDAIPQQEFVSDVVETKEVETVKEDKVEEQLPSQEVVKSEVDNEEVEKLMNEIIEENKEREKELEKEMGELES